MYISQSFNSLNGITKMENKEVRYFSEDQVKELLRIQRKICGKVADRPHRLHMIDFEVSNSEEPNFPEPIQVVPIEQVKEVVDKLEKKIKDIEYSMEFKKPDYLEESLRGRLLRAKQEAYLDCHTLIKIALQNDGK